MDTKDLISVAEAAEIAGCSDTTIRNKLRTGELDGEKIGLLVWMVRRSAVVSMAPSLSNRTTRNRAAAAAKREPQRRRSARAK
jgi:excisionase family DNA binding protein